MPFAGSRAFNTLNSSRPALDSRFAVRRGWGSRTAASADDRRDSGILNDKPSALSLDAGKPESRKAGKPVNLLCLMGQIDIPSHINFELVRPIAGLTCG
jgi:hypothetical protein